MRGRIQTRNYEVNNEKRQAVELVAEKVTFLTGKRPNTKTDVEE